MMQRSRNINTTFNITVDNWRELIEEDTTLTNPQKEEKIKLILDYIGDSATRYFNNKKIIYIYIFFYYI